jgi:hypothetical protein
MSTEHTVDDSEQMLCDRFKGEQCPDCKYYAECDISFDDCQLNIVNRIKAHTN